MRLIDVGGYCDNTAVSKNFDNPGIISLLCTILATSII
jgi:hypothetical protein